MTWIQTYTGIQFDLLNPTPEMVVIEDIAHSLARLCRFTGHANRFYSVAQHSWLCSFKSPPKYALEALLHDAHEAYTGDLNRPLKALCPAYKDIQSNIDRVIREKFNLPIVCSPIVKNIDRTMLYTEKRDLFSNNILWRGSTLPYDMKICPLDVQSSEIMFMETWKHVGRDHLAK